MATPREFQPTDILYHRYQKPKVLIQYVKTLEEKYTDDDITVKVRGPFLVNPLIEPDTTCR